METILKTSADRETIRKAIHHRATSPRGAEKFPSEERCTSGERKTRSTSDVISQLQDAIERGPIDGPSRCFTDDGTKDGET